MKKKVEKTNNRQNNQKLTEQENYLANLQKRLICQTGDLARFLNDETVINYAKSLAKHYFPKRFGNDVYLEPVIDSFTADLVLAPILHSKPFLWRYNYSDLDLLGKIYYQSHKRNGYFHIAHGEIEPFSRLDFETGLEILGINIGDFADKLWAVCALKGMRASVARRIVEAIAGTVFDEEMNKKYGFDESIQIRNLLKKQGKGKFRYLRQGRRWMAVGSAKGESTVDIRYESISNLWGYQIRFDKKVQKIRIAVSRQEIEFFKAQILGILDSQTTSHLKLKKVSDTAKKQFFLEC